MRKNNNFLHGIIFAFISSLCLGISGIVDKVGTTHASDPFIFSTQSIASSLFFSIIFALVYFRKKFLINFKNITLPSLRLIFFVGIFASGLFVLFRFLGLTQSTGTFATISQIITTSSSALLAAIFLRERLSKKSWVLLIAIIISVYFISVGKITLTTLRGGDIFIIISALFLGFGNIFSQIAVKNLSPIVLAAGRFLIGFVFLLLINIFLFQNSSYLLMFNIWALISGLLWAINVLVFNFSIQRIPLTLSLSIIMTAAVYTMILEYLIVKQTFNLLQIISAIAVVISGILMVYLKNK